MSLQFVYGPSGSGKSSYIQNRIIEDSIKDPARKYLLIVPDQFTMLTQVRMIELHPDHAFSNIEVLSFSRFSHRILEEVGGKDIPVLDDTGKNLIIRHVASDVKDKLIYMSERIDKYGFISEIKSAISEFMQYGLKPDDVGQLSDRAEGRRLLSLKLKDLETIYRAFMDYKSDHFLTREETLDVVSACMNRSKLIKNADIWFDGFTGFTPIQERVIQEMMVYARRVAFAFTMPSDIDIYSNRSEEDMFYLPYTSVIRLKKLSEQVNVQEDEAIGLGRGQAHTMLSHLESHIFRYPSPAYEGDDTETIKIYKAANISEEIRDTFARIRTLITQKKYRYRDIAVVTGDLSAYADEFKSIASELDIPIYMDYSRSVMGTDLVEAIISAYDVLRSDYTCESVIRHMRTGFGPLGMEETDELENFLLKRGIRGRKAFSSTWTVNPDKDREETPEAAERRAETFTRINAIREKTLSHFASLHNKEVSYTRALYDFIEASGMHEKLELMSTRIADLSGSMDANAYLRIYDKIMELLDQIEALCGSEIEDIDEFTGILEAGLTELKVGVIPQERDQIQIGDMTRTRLGHVKAVFLLGANDCNIPGKISGGGIISDIDREFLLSLDGVTLSPTPRAQMFTQRLYLYMNMSKPVDGLYISYVLTDPSGKSMQASYLIGVLCKLFPKITVESSDIDHICEGRVMPPDISKLKTGCASLMRAYMAGSASEDDIRALTAMCRVLNTYEMSEVYESICTMASAHYEHVPLPDNIAEGLYGKVLAASVSRLERFAGCAYAHFLSYGLKVRPRSEYSFERNDMGNVYHHALEEFSNKIKSEGLTWDGFTDSDADAWVDDIVENIIKTYSDTILISNNRNIALGKRMKRVIRRSVDTIRYQITQGGFIPAFFEKAFDVKKMAGIGDGRRVPYRLTGKIDRIDIAETKEGSRYLRVVDYKSGNKDFSLTGLYYGLMLQLPIYLGEAVKENAGADPAGMLYFHVTDPVIETSDELDEAQAVKSVRADMRMKGAVVGEEQVITLMDKSLGASSSSDIIPLKLTKDCVPDKRSKAYPMEIMKEICGYADKKCEELIVRIMNGDIDCMPVTYDSNPLPCKYCDFASVCRIYSRIDGYKSMCYDKTDTEEILEKIKENSKPEN